MSLRKTNNTNKQKIKAINCIDQDGYITKPIARKMYIERISAVIGHLRNDGNLIHTFKDRKKQVIYARKKPHIDCRLYALMTQTGLKVKNEISKDDLVKAGLRNVKLSFPNA